MLDELKSFTSSARYDTEGLVAMAAFGRAYEAEFTALGVEAPRWVGDQLKAVRREIKARNADAIASKLAAAKARLETLKTPDEKRAALQKEIEVLEKQAAEVGA